MKQQIMSLKISSNPSIQGPAQPLQQQLASTLQKVIFLNLYVILPESTVYELR